MNYPDQLNTIQWKKKRMEILKRDGFKCQECFNQVIETEYDKGFFSSFCLPNSKEAIELENIGTDRFMRAKINEEHTKFLKKSIIIYSQKIPNWKRIVMGMRVLDPREQEVFKKYESEISELKKKIDPFNSENLLESVIKNTAHILELKNKRRFDFIELNKKIDTKELEWIFMLGLHVHHKYYIEDYFAWEYPNDALITLCQSCHEKIHENQEIPVYNTEFEFQGYYTYCKRCHGAGVFPEYSHVQNGVCFRCDGMRYEELIPSSLA